MSYDRVTGIMFHLRGNKSNMITAGEVLYCSPLVDAVETMSMWEYDEGVIHQLVYEDLISTPVIHFRVSSDCYRLCHRPSVFSSKACRHGDLGLEH